MRLSATLLNNYNNINSFDTTLQWKVRNGEPNTLYFQLEDLDQNCGQGLRYLAGIGSQNQPYAVFVKFLSIDNTQVLNIQAIQADVNDSSVWSVTISQVQTPCSGNVLFTVIQGNVTRTFNVMNAIAVDFASNCGDC
jgi:hypothetical protein